MPTADLQAKFRDNANRVLPATQVEAIIQLTDRLEELPHLGDLMELCVK